MACGPNLKVLREMKARGVIRDCDLFVVTGLRKTQRDELRKRGELFNLYPVYEGGRGKFAYDDEVRCWQDWRDAWLAGETKMTWLDWFKHHCERDGEKIKPIT
jgi:hypothetical protein